MSDSTSIAFGAFFIFIVELFCGGAKAPPAERLQGVCGIRVVAKKLLECRVVFHMNVHELLTSS